MVAKDRIRSLQDQYGFPISSEQSSSKIWENPFESPMQVLKHLLLSSLTHFVRSLRKERDSNPRYPFGYTTFPGLPIRPLWHLSNI